MKQVSFTEDARAFTSYKLKPQMRTLGPKYGKLLGKIGQHLQTLDGNEVVDAFAAGETVRFELDGTQVELSGERRAHRAHPEAGLHGPAATAASPWCWTPT